MSHNIFTSMELISNIFDPEIMYPFIFLLGLSVYFFAKDKINSYIIIGSSVFTMVIIYTLKVLINKPRPDNMLIVESAGKAFPSGHSAIAGVFTALIIYFVNMHIKKASQKNVFLAKYKFVVYILVVILFLLIQHNQKELLFFQ